MRRRKGRRSVGEEAPEWPDATKLVAQRLKYRYSIYSTSEFSPFQYKMKAACPRLVTLMEVQGGSYQVGGWVCQQVRKCKGSNIHCRRVWEHRNNEASGTSEPSSNRLVGFEASRLSATTVVRTSRDQHGNV